MNPWRSLRTRPHIDVVWHKGLPNGETRWNRDGSVTIRLNERMGQAMRRSVLVHELQHVRLGPLPVTEAGRRSEERRVCEAAARLLIPLEALARVWVWSNSYHEMAEELWVDYFTFTTRLNTLTDAERAVLREVLERKGEVA